MAVEHSKHDQSVAVPAGAMGLYSSTFSGGSRVPDDEMSRTLASGKRVLWTASAGGDLVGIAIVLVLPATDSLLLEYVAVEAPARNSGTGTGLVREALDWGRRRGCRRMYVECRHPEDSVLAEDRGLALRRQAWYGRLGGLGIPFYPNHYSPSASSPDRAYTRRSLLQFPLAASPTITEAELSRALIDIVFLGDLGLDRYFVPRPSAQPAAC